jgi:hypothetical protein
MNELTSLYYVVAKRVLPNCGSAETYIDFFDTSLMEKTFVLAYLRFEEQVKSVVGHYLELKTRQRIAALTDEPAKSSVRLCRQGRANAYGVCETVCYLVVRLGNGV